MLIGTAMYGKGPSDSEYKGLTTGWHKTVDITVDANKSIATLYPGYVCRQICNIGSSDGVIKYSEVNDTGVVKTMPVVAGQSSGLLPVIEQINLSGTTATSLKLYLQKVN